METKRLNVAVTKENLVFYPRRSFALADGQDVSTTAKRIWIKDDEEEGKEEDE